MFGLSVSSMLMLYLVNVFVVYVVLAGFMPSWLGAKIDYRGKGMRLMLISLAWLPLAVGSMIWMVVRKNRQIDDMHEELEAAQSDKADSELKKQ